MSPQPLISVCILAGRGESLDACLASLREQSSPPTFEVLVGGRGPARQLLPVVRRHFARARVCDTGRRLPGEARNPLIERARGRLILFLDDDVVAPPAFLQTLAQIAGEHPEVAVFGGPNETPAGSSRFQVAQGAVLSSLVGAGPVRRRYGARSAGLMDERWFTLCNLAVRRSAMLPFMSTLVCAEENALLAELSRRGQTMLYEPRLRVFHERRASMATFATQMQKYGRGRGQLLRRRPSSVRLAYLAPVALLIYLLALVPGLALRASPSIALLPIALYLGLVVLSATRIGWTLRRAPAVPVAAVLSCIVHLCYGAGILRGLIGGGGAGGDHPPIRWFPATPGSPPPDAGASPQVAAA